MYIRLVYIEVLKTYLSAGKIYKNHVNILSYFFTQVLQHSFFSECPGAMYINIEPNFTQNFRKNNEQSLRDLRDRLSYRQTNRPTDKSNYYRPYWVN